MFRAGIIRARRPFYSARRAVHGLLGPHDVGGLEELLKTEISLHEPGYQFWERKTHAMLVLCVSERLLTVDELRRGIEALPVRQYSESSYYCKWASSMMQILLERNIISQTEVDAALGSVAELEEPKYRVGDSVAVRSEDTVVSFRKPHLRTPGYIFGATGVIERYCGAFGDPEFLAFRGAPDMKQNLYRVRFLQRDLWPEYAELIGESDTVDVEIYEGWLQEGNCTHDCGDEGGQMLQKVPGSRSCGHDHSGHTHVSRDQAEADACADEGPEDMGERLSAVLQRLLVQQGYFTDPEIHAAISAVDALGAAAEGPRIVARAWTDDAFRSHLLEDATEACRELDIFASNTTAPTVLTAVENTAEIHNLVVCTLCSCYPISLLGLSPPWYKSRAYRAQAVRQPRRLLVDTFGVKIPFSQSIRVHDSTADLRYIVIPERPPGTESWSEQQLQQLVTRDSMIGVATLKT